MDKSRPYARHGFPTAATSTSAVASTDEVLQYNATTGAFVSVFVSGVSGGPNNLAFGPDANGNANADLYVSTSNGVSRYNGTTGALSGNLYHQWVRRAEQRWSHDVRSQPNLSLRHVQLPTRSSSTTPGPAPTWASRPVPGCRTRLTSSSARTACCTCSAPGTIASSATRRPARTSMITSRPAAAAWSIPIQMAFGPNGDLYVSAGSQH